MEEIRTVLAGANWLNKTKDGFLTDVITTPLVPPFKTNAFWVLFHIRFLNVTAA
jgi:hypothetical protein